MKTIRFNHRKEYSEGVFRIPEPVVTVHELLKAKRLIVFDCWHTFDESAPDPPDWQIVSIGMQTHDRVTNLTLRIEQVQRCGSLWVEGKADANWVSKEDEEEA